MSNTLNQQLEDVIKKNLPQQLGEELQKRLKELEAKELQLDTIKTTLAVKVGENQKLNEELLKRVQADITLQAIESKTKEVEGRERNLENTILKNQLEQAEKRADICKELVCIVFKNPTFKTIEQRWGNMPVERTYNGGGSYIEQHPTNTTVEIKTEQE